MNALFRKVARELRYLSLSDIIGSLVTIDSIETIQADCLRALAPSLPATAVLDGPEQRFLIGALLKYGLMDLTFVIPEACSSVIDAVGIPLLEQLGFVREPEPQPSATVEDDLWDDDPTCLAELVEDLNAQRLVVRLFLELPQDTARSAWLDDPARLFEPFLLPTDYFPRTFTVCDACITNARFVWFHKHFYL